MARRQSCRQLILVGTFTLLLTCLLYLAHDPVPKASHLIGWQAFQSIVLPSTGSKTASQAESDLDGSGSPSNGTLDGGAIATAEELALPSYPLDTYAPFLPNPAPITEIAVQVCLPLSTCRPKTTAEQDALLGKWVRVERPLDPTAQLGAASGGILSNLFGSIDQRYLFYRKSIRYDVPRVVEIRLVESGTDKRPKGKGWHRAKHDLRSKYLRMWAKEKNMHLYFRTVGGSAEDEDHARRAETDRDGGTGASRAAVPPGEEAITELDLVYGDNPPWPGFSLAGVVSPSHRSLGASQVTLSIRRKPTPHVGTLPPTFRRDGTFKILQLADLHFSVTPEPCRDVANADTCLAKNDTLRLITRWFDEEKPDLVVFSGDQLNGQGTSWDERSVIPLFVTPLIERRIPWAAILGNHDSETGTYTRTEQMRLLQHLPFSLSRVGPAELTGDGNYYIDLHSPFTDRTLLSTLWFFDSGARAPKDKWRPWKQPGYGWVHADQVKWFVDKMSARKEALLPYRPDGAEDLGPQWRRRGPQRPSAKRRPRPIRADVEWNADADQGQTPGKPPSLLFMHIPPPEAFAPVDRDPIAGELITGVREETATFSGAQSQTGIFDAILSLHRDEAGASGQQNGSGLAKKGSVKLLCHGHMHLNEDCRRVDGVWICFAGGSSFAGYGKVGFKRRARVIEMSAWGAKMATWHRLEGEEERRDEIVLV